MHSCFWLWISPLLSPEYGANKMLFSGHFQKCLTIRRDRKEAGTAEGYETVRDAARPF